MTLEWAPLPPQAPDLATNAPEVKPARSADFKHLFEALGRELDEGEALVERATQRGSGAVSATELIALQAGIYRYTEAVELTARFVDRAQNALRTTLESGGA